MDAVVLDVLIGSSAMAAGVLARAAWERRERRAVYAALPRLDPAPVVPETPPSEPERGRPVAQKPAWPDHHRCACGAPGLACPVHTPRR